MFCLKMVDRVLLSLHLIYIPSYSFLSYLDPPKNVKYSTKVHIIKARYNATKYKGTIRERGKYR